ncbi:Na+/H+ antiporter subunit E [Ramlibacter tataouinensis]|uniref:Candidate ultisubunit Na+/H+ antiporter, MnhE subunit n=1 Tax=Ramlibacter tataouinensis (strain ATCC BAA-407 / DSM 14655 / LMG 21543 / TTB310) TaxID=365046 RepID=F5XWC4_RAMTT|nr:Na+/H+ antiporter subunit E [Ramlibacter tataouinensis]AEG91694.1 Candidate ultisubunit Na+/H+ antiporter, MnhE subunit [Ramlibacter tataouinensis TTB310]
MKSFVPYPLLTFALLVIWLTLNDSIDPAHVLLGLLIGLAGGNVYARLEPPRKKFRNFLVPAAALIWLVFVDIVRSNIAVARIALHLPARDRVAGFLPIPLELREPAGLAVLACIVTATPGTSWAHYDAAASVLTLHVLDLVDEETWVRQFKDRYERRLMEIFG